jgi:hypothetical protein
MKTVKRIFCLKSLKEFLLKMFIFILQDFQYNLIYFIIFVIEIKVLHF